jgi:hypothetical protein
MLVLNMYTAVLWIPNDFWDPAPTFQLVSDPDNVPDPTWIFSNILDINFTFVFPSCKCVRLLIMTRCKLFRGICLDKKEFLFLNWSSLLRNDKILTVYQSSFAYFRKLPESGSGMIFPGSVSGSGSCKKFGSDRIRIHNTDTQCHQYSHLASSSWYNTET